MNTPSDPFEAFRRAREKDGYRQPRAEERSFYATRIDKVLEEVETRRENGAKLDSDIPMRSRVQSLVSQLYRALDRADPFARATIVSMLNRFADEAELLIRDQSTLLASDLVECRCDK